MSEQNFFRDALSDFTYEAASGGAIRHLADLGYTVKQIGERLTYPTPYERVRKTVWQHLLDTKVLLTQEPGSGETREKAEYVVEHDKYGRTSYRLLTVQRESGGVRSWRERNYSREKDGNLAAYLAKMCDRNGEESAYVSCDFGIWQRRDRKRLDKAMQTLNERQREYISGLIWEDKICYHRLNQRMREMIVKLYETGYYQGTCFFLRLAEKVEL